LHVAARIKFLKKKQNLISLGASKSVGFIRFDQRCEAEVAISKLNGTIPKGTKRNSMKFIFHSN
jgi:hypothetical protein